MINEKGQAFDAFKLLIAAVVAGAILVIIIGILRPESWFFTDPATEITNLIHQVKTTPGHASPGNVVTFRVGETYTHDGLASSAQMNKGAVFFCVANDWPRGNTIKDYNFDMNDTVDDTKPNTEWTVDACPSGYLFPADAFSGSKRHSLSVDEQISGTIRAYRTNDIGSTKIFIGFKRA